MAKDKRSQIASSDMACRSNSFRNPLRVAEGERRSLEEKTASKGESPLALARQCERLPASVQKTFPFLVCPKASKSEKNKGCEDLPERHATALQFNLDDSFKDRRSNNVHHRNYHPTVKPLKLMSYLITLGSREGDIILDPFVGSGTTALACKLLNRKCIGIEISEDYCRIAVKRCSQSVLDLGV